MASSSQRVHFLLSPSLSQNSIQFFLWSRGSTPNGAALPIVHGYYIERCFRVRFLTTERWSWRTVQRVLHVCKDEASVFENCQKYRNAKSQYKHVYVVSVSNAPCVTFDCLCSTYVTVNNKLTLRYTRLHGCIVKVYIYLCMYYYFLINYLFR